MTNEQLAVHWHWIALVLAMAVVVFWTFNLSLTLPLASLISWECIGVVGHYWLRVR